MRYQSVNFLEYSYDSRILIPSMSGHPGFETFPFHVVLTAQLFLQKLRLEILVHKHLLINFDIIVIHMNIQNSFDICLILHGCPPTPETVTPIEKRWMNWLAQQLNEKGYNAIAPELPASWAPDYAVWKKEFEKYPVTENSLLIGHSCGGAFLVRWLFETGKKVKKLILVAPAKVPEKEDDARNAMYEFEFPENAQKIADEIVLFTSNDFPHHLKSLEIYTKELNPRVIKLENKGHFLFYQTGTNEFPELLEEVISSQ